MALDERIESVARGVKTAVSVEMPNMTYVCLQGVHLIPSSEVSDNFPSWSLQMQSNEVRLVSR